MQNTQKTKNLWTSAVFPFSPMSQLPNADTWTMTSKTECENCHNPINLVIGGWDCVVSEVTLRCERCNQKHVMKDIDYTNKPFVFGCTECTDCWARNILCDACDDGVERMNCVVAYTEGAKVKCFRLHCSCSALLTHVKPGK